jgi:hypothetical protein
MQDKTNYAGPGLHFTRRNGADPMEMATMTDPMSLSDLFSVVALRSWRAASQFDQHPSGV